MGLGSTIGGVAGTIAGGALTVGTLGMAAPMIPVMASAGSALGAGIGGGVDALAAKGKRKRAEGMLPEMVDPMEANRYNELKLREKQLMTGTAFQTALGENRKTQAATIQGVNQASGGAGGAAIAAMLRADALAGRTNNETLGKGLEQNNFLSQEMSALATRIAQRKFALQKQKYQQGMYDATAAQGEANSDLKAQLARTNYQPIIDMLGGKGNRGEDGGGGAVVGGANSPFVQQTLDGIGTPLTFGQQPNGMNFPTGIGSVQPQGVFGGNGAAPNFSWNQPPANGVTPNFNPNQPLQLGGNGWAGIPNTFGSGTANKSPLGIGATPPQFKMGFNGGATQVAPTQVQPVQQQFSGVIRGVTPPQSSSVTQPSVTQPSVTTQPVVTPSITPPQSSSVITNKNTQSTNNPYSLITGSIEKKQGYGTGFSTGATDPKILQKYPNAASDPIQAQQAYDEFYYPLVKDLPMPLQIVAGDFGFNSEDPRGALLEAYGFVDHAGKQDYYTKGADGKMHFDSAKVEKDWNDHKDDIIQEYDKDPTAFLDKFDKARKDSYKGTSKDKAQLDEWFERIDISRKKANEYIK